jgi:hypothetical protein
LGKQGKSPDGGSTLSDERLSLSDLCSGPGLPKLAGFRRSLLMPIEHLDVLVVGAGISGISAGYHLQDQCPGK